jgi:two-component system response regulator MprA
VSETRAKCILVVDDEDAIRDALTDSLEFEGYRVESAANGQQALAKVRATRPDAIVLDLMMPVMDGWTFMQECRKDPACVCTPVLVISAHRALQETTSTLDVQACLAKPFDLDVLVGAVQRLLRTD